MLTEEIQEGGYDDDGDDEEGRDHKKEGHIGAKANATNSANTTSGSNGAASSGTIIAPSASARGLWNYCIGLVGKVRTSRNLVNGERREKRKVVCV